VLTAGLATLMASFGHPDGQLWLPAAVICGRS